ncbi:hypothetical protein ES705_24222 [subsurface metagenome]
MKTARLARGSGAGTALSGSLRMRGIEGIPRDFPPVRAYRSVPPLFSPGAAGGDGGTPGGLPPGSSPRGRRRPHPEGWAIVGGDPTEPTHWTEGNITHSPAVAPAIVASSPRTPAGRPLGLARRACEPCRCRFLAVFSVTARLLPGRGRFLAVFSATARFLPGRGRSCCEVHDFFL